MSKYDTLSEEDCRRLYKLGAWHCNVPPVCTAGWTDENWIAWIQTHGQFIGRCEHNDCNVPVTLRNETGLWTCGNHKGDTVVPEGRS